MNVDHGVPVLNVENRCRVCAVNVVKWCGEWIWSGCGPWRIDRGGLGWRLQVQSVDLMWKAESESGWCRSYLGERENAHGGWGTDIQRGKRTWKEDVDGGNGPRRVVRTNGGWRENVQAKVYMIRV